MTRVEICGGIASGKTTLAALLGDYTIPAVFEDFKTNPFWQAFYADPASHAFETEVTFLLQHYHQFKTSSGDGSTFVCDASLLLDLAYADVNLAGSKKATFLAVYNEVQRILPPPELLVHLICGEEEELKRIRRRARPEEKSVAIEYLGALNKAVATRVEEVRNDIRVLQLDSEHEDFATNEQIRTRVAKLILGAMS